MLSLPEEQWLEDQLCRDGLAVDCAEQALAIQGGYRDVGVRKRSLLRQVALRGAGVADLVATFDEPRAIVIIEVKKIADESSVAQVLRYVGSLKLWMSQHSSAKVGVFGCVAAFRIETKAALAAHGCGVTMVELSVGRVPYIYEYMDRVLELSEEMGYSKDLEKTFVDWEPAPSEPVHVRDIPW